MFFLLFTRRNPAQQPVSVPILYSSTVSSSSSRSREIQRLCQQSYDAEILHSSALICSTRNNNDADVPCHRTGYDGHDIHILVLVHTDQSVTGKLCGDLSINTCCYCCCCAYGFPRLVQTARRRNTKKRQKEKLSKYHQVCTRYVV